MKQNIADRLLLGGSIAGFSVQSISLFLMPIEQMRILPGALFWIGLAIGIAGQIALEVRRSLLFAKYNVKRETMQKPRNGLLSFGSNPIASVADGLLICSTVATALAFVLTNGAGYICYVCLSLLVFSFCMHCIFNGRNYIYVKNQSKIRQVLDQKQANSAEKGEKSK